AVKAYADRKPRRDDYFFLIAPKSKLYGHNQPRTLDAKETGKKLEKIKPTNGKAAVGGPNLKGNEVAEYGSKDLRNLGVNVNSIVTYFRAN
ncbi:hypothetical protein AAVH_42669, partial [Aphelenchoides avenae]